jgi:L-fuculose-phosphate aldolase
LPGSTALADSIVKTFQQGFFAVILENHGVVVGGHNLHEAFARFETLEFTAKTIIKASTLGPVRYLSDEQLALAHKLDDKLPSFDPPPATSAEKELRLQLAAFLQRGYRNRLVISTQGSFSARLDEQAFLITPVNLDRQRAAVDDLVLVRGGAAETGKTASRATRLHQAIYERNPDVGAVFNAYTVNATAFGVTGSPPDARTIPESFLLLRDVQWIPFGQQFAACDAVAGQISMRNPIAILENDGVLVAGRNVLDAFDRLEVLEATAETLINGRLIGQPRPMSDKVIAELAEAFKGM